MLPFLTTERKTDFPKLVLVNHSVYSLWLVRE
jgi:hypothetical protein